MKRLYKVKEGDQKAAPEEQPKPESVKDEIELTPSENGGVVTTKSKKKSKR
jgi:hypothetical protein